MAPFRGGSKENDDDTIWADVGGSSGSIGHGMTVHRPTPTAGGSGRTDDPGGGRRGRPGSRRETTPLTSRRQARGPWEAVGESPAGARTGGRTSSLAEEEVPGRREGARDRSVFYLLLRKRFLADEKVPGTVRCPCSCSVTGPPRPAIGPARWTPARPDRYFPRPVPVYRLRELDRSSTPRAAADPGGTPRPLAGVMSGRSVPRGRLSCAQAIVEGGGRFRRLSWTLPLCRSRHAPRRRNGFDHPDRSGVGLRAGSSRAGGTGLPGNYRCTASIHDEEEFTER